MNGDGRQKLMLRLRLEIDLLTCTGQGTQIGQRDGEGFGEAGDPYNALRGH